jgi:hypothetical protein
MAGAPMPCVSKQVKASSNCIGGEESGRYTRLPETPDEPDATWQKIHDALHDKLRRREDRKTSPSAAIIDSQTVNTTEVGGPHGYDAGKKINGRKWHIVVDTLGLVLAVVVHPANVQDHDGAVLVIEFLGRLEERFRRLRVIFADSAYWPESAPGVREGCVRVAAANCAPSGRSEEVRVAAEALDRGADLRLAGEASKAQQGLRAEHSIKRGNDLYRNESSDAQATCSQENLIHRHPLRSARYARYPGTNIRFCCYT